MPMELKTENDGSLLEITVSGTLTKADYETALPQIEKQMEEKGKVRMLFEMKDFHGWEMGAAWEDLKFGTHHAKDIERLAMVGENKWEKIMAILSKPFFRAESRYFDQSQRDEAINWVQQ